MTTKTTQVTKCDAPGCKKKHPEDGIREGWIHFSVNSRRMTRRTSFFADESDVCSFACLIKFAEHWAEKQREYDAREAESDRKRVEANRQQAEREKLRLEQLAHDRKRSWGEPDA